MMMEEQIAQFPKQFLWEPQLEHEDTRVYAEYLVCGMGGSHLGARLLLRADTTLPIRIHSDYGLPPAFSETIEDTLIVVSSYSGDTEEALDALHVALDAHLPVAVITSGGALLARARELQLPLCVLPHDDIEPRMALGYQMLALARILRSEKTMTLVRTAGQALTLTDAQERGQELATHIAGKLPIFYASTQNAGLAYHLKASMNETAKMPAFFSSIPEACHNELSGYDTGEVPNGALALVGIFLEDEEDDIRVTKRMRLMRNILQTQGVSSHVYAVTGTSGAHKALATALTGSYAGVALARTRNVPDAKTPLIAEFKKRMNEL